MPKRMIKFYPVIGLSAFLFFLFVFILFGFFSRETTSSRDALKQAFYQECINDVLADKIYPENCKSVSLIREHYGLDIWQELEIQQGKMIMTARRISRGEILDKNSYNECIRVDECAKIPLAVYQKKNKEKAQALFDHLINNGRLSPDLCYFMKLCHSMVKTGLITIKRR